MNKSIVCLMSSTVFALSGLLVNISLDRAELKSLPRTESRSDRVTSLRDGEEEQKAFTSFEAYLDSLQEDDARSHKEKIASYLLYKIKDLNVKNLDDILQNLERLGVSDEVVSLIIGTTASYRGVDEASRLLEFFASDQAYASGLATIAVAAAASEPQKAISLLQKENSYLLTDPAIAVQLLRSFDNVMSLEEKLNWIRGFPTGAARTELFQAFGSFMTGSVDKPARVKKLLEKVNSLPKLEKERTIHSFLSDLIKSNPTDFLAQLDQLQVDRSSLTQDQLFQIGGGIFNQGERSIDTLSEIMNGLSTHEALLVTNGFVEEWARANPEAAARYSLDQFQNGNGTGRLVSSSMEVWFATDPKEALAFLNSNMDMGVGGSGLTVLQHNFDKIVTRSPEVAKSIIESKEYPDLQDGMIVHYSTSILKESPEEAFHIAKEIKNPISRAETLHSMSLRYSELAPSKALDLALEFPKGQERDVMLEAIASNLLRFDVSSYPHALRNMSTPEAQMSALTMLYNLSLAPGQSHAGDVVESVFVELEEQTPGFYEEFLQNL